MKRLIAAVVVVSFGAYTLPAFAQTHVITAELVRDRLGEQNDLRKADLALLTSILSGDPVAEARSVIHVDTDVLLAGLSTLSDSELHDLAARARRLQSDPQAGMSGGIKKLFWALVIIGAVLGVIYAIASIGCGQSCHV